MQSKSEITAGRGDGAQPGSEGSTAGGTNGVRLRANGVLAASHRLPRMACRWAGMEYGWGGVGEERPRSPPPYRVTRVYGALRRRGGRHPNAEGWFTPRLTKP